MNERIKLPRDCEAIQIPSGVKITLPAGTEVVITQSLGGSYTVATEEGILARIAAKDADAIGQRSKAPNEAAASTGEAAQEEIEKRVWGQLRMVYDPEIPVNIVDLGLVYLCRITPLPEGGNKVEIKMTLTAPGCGMGGVLKADAETKLRSVPGIKTIDVELVVDPPWNPSRMSEAAKLHLGMM